MKKLLAHAILIAAAAMGFAQSNLGGYQNGTIGNAYGPPVQWRPVAEGVNSRITTFDQRIFTNQKDWAEHYAKMVGNDPQYVSRTPQLCDFNRQHLIVLHSGQQPTPGHRIYVSTISRPRANVKLVEAIISSPPAGLIAAQMVTSPYIVIAVDIASGDYQFGYTKATTRAVSLGTGGGCNCNCGCTVCGCGTGASGALTNILNGVNVPDICPPLGQLGNRGSGGRDGGL